MPRSPAPPANDDDTTKRAESLRAEGYSYALIQRELGIPYLKARELAGRYDATHGKPKRVMRRLPAPELAGEPMSIPVRELRNHTARILRQVEKGHRFLVTVSGRGVAELAPVASRSYFVPRSVVERIIREAPLDRGFKADIDQLLDQRIDEL